MALEWTLGPQPPRISAAATLASAAVAARRTFRPLFIERILDIRGDVRASVDHVGLVETSIRFFLRATSVVAARVWSTSGLSS